VNLAAAWAYEYRDWIRSETSGVALIQIHASPRTDTAQEDPAGMTSRNKVGVDLARSFSWLTSPIEGALGARDWSMLYRNEEQIRLLDDAFNSTEGTPRMFETFVLTNPGGAAMNWIISLGDVQDMRESINQDMRESINGSRETNEIEKTNRRQMEKLVAWWNAKQYPRRLERPISTPDRPRPPAAATSRPTGQRLRTRDRAGRGDAPLPDDRLLDLPLGPLLPPDRGVAEPGHLASDERAADPAQPVLAVADDHHRQPDPAAHRLGTVYVRPVLQRLIAVRRGPQVTMPVEASTMTTHMKPPSCPSFRWI